MTPADLPSVALAFLAERHLASFTSLRADGTPHVVPVGFTWDAAHSIARVITTSGNQKALNAARDGSVVLCQIDGARWLSLEGDARVSDDLADVADGIRRYAIRYREPRVNPNRVVIEVQVSRVLGSQSLLSPRSGSF
jgi:F420H(2)-dependent biliverdin reductase